jgi:predicted dehydrogenase
MGRRHARTIAASSQARLGVVVDRHLERAVLVAETTGSQASRQLEDALDCDAAIVATAAEEHVDIAMALLDAGRPVLIEKPIAFTLPAIQRVLAASERSGVPVMCGFVERFNQAVVTAQRLMLEPPTRITTARHSTALPRSTTPVALDLLIHDADLAIHFTGGDTILQTHNVTTAKTSEHVDCRLQFARGATAWLSASRLAPERTRSITITAGRRILDLDLIRQTVSVGHLDSPHRATAECGPATDPLSRQLDHVLELHAGRVDAAHERRTLLAPHAVACRLVAP